MAEHSRIEELRRRVQMDPASIAFAALAEEYRRAGRHDEAIATCEAGLQRHPAYLSARVTLGRALLETGRLDEARHQLEHVLRVAPENLAAIRALADIHGRNVETAENAPPADGASDATASGTEDGRPVQVSAAVAPLTAEQGPRLVYPALPQEDPRLASAPAVQPQPEDLVLPALEELLAAITAARTAGQDTSTP